MTPPTRLELDCSAIDDSFWPRLAADVADAVAARSAPLRDAVLLVPHGGLLGAARSAFARRGGWQPRIETLDTLAAALAPADNAQPGTFSGDEDTDRLQAAALLRRQPVAAAWAVRDPRAFAAATTALLSTAQSLKQASARRASATRDAWWTALRQALPPLQGPGASERLLARLALEWAASAPLPRSDALLTLHPSAWVVLTAAGQGEAALGLLAAHSPSPLLQVVADSAGLRPFDAVAALPAPRRLRAGGLEDEAQGATLAVIEALDAGAASVALVAQDRLVVRRIRALLDRAGIAVDDETGWTLSTTRSAARLMAWLRAAAPDGSRDAQIEALRAENADAAAVDALEAAWRSEREPPARALALHDHWRRRVEALQLPRARPLTQWLQALREHAGALLATLDGDAAGRRLLGALRLQGPVAAAWTHAAQHTVLDLAGFTDWVDQTLEHHAWQPTAAPAAPVTIVPLQRTVLRPFDAVVFPGCDAQHLGAVARLPGLLPPALAREFGISDAAQRQDSEQRAFALLLRAPQLTLLRRTHDGSEPLAASPLVARAMLARRRRGTAVDEERAVVLPARRVARQPLARPAPSMATALPASVSATLVQALRDCPYRFFARAALRLREGSELGAEFDRSDYGRWVHGLLYRFHVERRGDDDLAQLQAAADAEQAELGLDATALLPFRIAFDRFAADYLAWLQAHEDAGWRFAAGEVQRQSAPPDLDGLVLDGRLDRIDRDRDGRVMLIDYKTGSRDKDKLKQQVREPLEDTQLAFYAALLDVDEGALPPRALYLAFGEREPPLPIEHPDVARSAAALIDGLAGDLAALRAGAGAAALGEGDVCRHCEARGLCRRDHWSVP